MSASLTKTKLVRPHLGERWNKQQIQTKDGIRGFIKNTYRETKRTDKYRVDQKKMHKVQRTIICNSSPQNQTVCTKILSKNHSNSVICVICDILM